MATEEKKKTAAKKTVKKKEPTGQKKYRVKADLDQHMLVTVTNGFAGKLYYRSRRTGEEYEWQEFGDEQDMELSELKNARNSAKDFFERNYFMIDDPEVIEYLNAKQYYDAALSVEEFDELFEKTPKEITQTVEGLSRGQKNTLKYHAKEKIANGEVDSIKVIDALEKSLGVQLIER